MPKEHLEFHPLDLDAGWERPAGYPEGIDQKILAGGLDPANQRGSQTRLLRFQPGAFTTEPFEHDYWEEVFLIEGDLIVGGEKFTPWTYAVRPPHTPHGPFKSDRGCLLLETHYFDQFA
jgi:hypothetical protein